MAPHSLLRKLYELNRASPQFHQQLSSFFRGSEYLTVFPDLHGGNLAWLVEYLDNVLVDISDRAARGPLFQECLHELGKICSIKKVLPKSCTVAESLLGCVYEGTFDGSKVRVRRVRVHSGGDPQKLEEAFRQIAVTSKRLLHPNIVPLLGVTVEPLEFISNWMPGGDLLGYIAKHPDADRLFLLSDVAEGLNYLHSCNVIHGDLNGSNILLDATGNARITDFGLAMVTQDPGSIRRATADHRQSPRWIAPEILGNRGTYSKEADVFSFAGVTIEAFTGAIPFNDKSPRAAILAITSGERPTRLTHPSVTDGLWALIQQCWDQEAHLRPRALRISCGFGIPAWKRLIGRPLTSKERISLITYIFSDRDETELVGSLCGDDAQSFVDVVDQMLDSLKPRLRKKALSTLCKICGRQALLPRALQIPRCYDRSDDPPYSGGYADVWMGEHQGRKVAVKVLRVLLTSDLDKITKRFCKEVMTWKSLRHPNVLPLLGVTMGGKHFAMISEWMVNGNINQFVNDNRNANRFELLKGVASGLIYMHSQEMVHGDLKGANVMVDRDGHARLADFGLLTFVLDPTNPTTSSSATNAGTTRWMSPELLHPEQFGFGDGRPTKQSDCYALGMVILEVLSREPPFARDNECIVMWKVIEGEHPERPRGDGAWFTDNLWRTLEQCWSPQPNDRPTVEAVLKCLERASKVWQPPPPVSEDVGTDGNVSYPSCYYTPRSVSHLPGPSKQVEISTPYVWGGASGSLNGNRSVPPTPSLREIFRDESLRTPRPAPASPKWPHQPTATQPSRHLRSSSKEPPERKISRDPFASDTTLYVRPDTYTATKVNDFSTRVEYFVTKAPVPPYPSLTPMTRSSRSPTPKLPSFPTESLPAPLPLSAAKHTGGFPSSTRGRTGNGEGREGPPTTPTTRSSSRNSTSTLQPFSIRSLPTPIPLSTGKSTSRFPSSTRGRTSNRVGRERPPPTPMTRSSSRNSTSTLQPFSIRSLPAPLPLSTAEPAGGFPPSTRGRTGNREGRERPPPTPMTRSSSRNSTSTLQPLSIRSLPAPLPLSTGKPTTGFPSSNGGRTGDREGRGGPPPPGKTFTDKTGTPSQQRPIQLPKSSTPSNFGKPPTLPCGSSPAPATRSSSRNSISTPRSTWSLPIQLPFSASKPAGGFFSSIGRKTGSRERKERSSPPSGGTLTKGTGTPSQQRPAQLPQTSTSSVVGETRITSGSSHHIVAQPVPRPEEAKKRVDQKLRSTDSGRRPSLTKDTSPIIASNYPPSHRSGDRKHPGRTEKDDWHDWKGF